MVNCKNVPALSLVFFLIAAVTITTATPVFAVDTDQDGLPDSTDACPIVEYDPVFDWSACAPTDGDPANDPEPQCKARERVIQTLLSSGVFVTHIALAIVVDGEIHFADAFSYIGAGQYVHDPDGVNRLYRIGSTSKSVTAVAAKVLEESGELSLDDFVNDEDATQLFVGGERTLRQLLSHQGAFKLDSGAIHLFCYPGDLASFWLEPDDLISPHYDSAVYGNLGGGYQYSAFNYSLAGAYLANRTGESLAEIIQTRVFDPAGMCTATLDGFRAVGTAIGYEAGTSQASVMHVGPYINLVSPTDELCEDNFYSSEDVYGDPYTWQIYHVDEAAAEARDPAGGVIASVIDMAHFARTLLGSYHGEGGLLSPEGVRDLWGATSDLGCFPGCPYARYYAIGFFSESQPGEPATHVEHGGSRAGYASGFALRPEANTAVCVLANADVSTVALSNLAKTILNDLDAATGVDSGGGVSAMTSPTASIGPNPFATRGTTAIRFSIPRDARVQLQVFDVAGRLVSTLAEDTYSAGDHRVLWSPAEDGLTAGVYFVWFASTDTKGVLKVVISP